MTFSAAERDERNERAQRLVLEMASLADQLAGLGHRAALAAVRADFGELCDAADELDLVHARFSELYLALMVAGRPRRRLALVYEQGDRDGD